MNCVGQGMNQTYVCCAGKLGVVIFNSSRCQGKRELAEWKCMKYINISMYMFMLEYSWIIGEFFCMLDHKQPGSEMYEIDMVEA